MHDIERLLTGLSGSMKRTFEIIGDDDVGHDWRTSALIEQTIAEDYTERIPMAYGRDSNLIYSQSETKDGLDGFKAEVAAIFNNLSQGDSIKLTVTRSNGTLKTLMVDNPIDDFIRSQRLFTKNPELVENVVGVFNDFLEHIEHTLLTDLEKETVEGLVDSEIKKRYRDEVRFDEF